MKHHYRLYCLDSAMHIAAQREFDAEDDDAAVEFARREDAHFDREIWEEHRKVAIVRAEQ